MKIYRTIKFIIQKKMYTWSYWVYFCRYLRLKIFQRRVKTEGFVFLRKNARIYVGKNGRITLGPWSWIGENDALICIEGELKIGKKTVLGSYNEINCHTGIEIGDECIFADFVVLIDFDHAYKDLNVSIRKQPFSKDPIKIGNDVWLGAKVTVLKGSVIGDGCVVGAHSVVKSNIPPHSVAAGISARVIKQRGPNQTED